MRRSLLKKDIAMGRHKRRESLGTLEIAAFVESATRFHSQLMEYHRKLTPRGEHYKLTSAVADQLRAGIQGLTGKDVPWSSPNGIRQGSQTPDEF
jgi:hypothetical protein